jgi:trans-2,3-dihydro-3-hydroxyanthranilate isomerase
MTSKLMYDIVDVFTDRPFTGNPLAVVYGAQELGGEQLQAIAREFNLSETIFVMPPTQPGATYKVRIYTTVHELPFAGHPSVGVAVAQLRRGLVEPGDLVMECQAGLLAIQLDASGKATVTGGTPTVGDELDPAPFLDAIGLTVEDYLGPAPRFAGAGLSWPFLLVHPEAVTKATVPDPKRIPGVAVLSWDAATNTAHARVLCPGHGVAEDPATGSAALGLGVWLVSAGLLPGDGTSRYTIHQGAEIHRPSTLECTVTAVDGSAVSTTVTGHVVAIASGEIAVPPFVG